MVTVQRQRSFHRPNGKKEDAKNAKGKGGNPLRTVIVAPYKKGETSSMKKIYAELTHKLPVISNVPRNLRRKLAKMKMPMKEKNQSIGRKKNHAAHRPRRVIWPSEQKNR